MTANGLIKLVEEWPGCQQMFGGPEGLLNRPKLFVAQHDLKRVEIAVKACFPLTNGRKKPTPETVLNPSLAPD
jgi:hypothetical protein